MKIKSLLLLGLALPALFSCTTAPGTAQSLVKTVNQKRIQDYYPLKVGDRRIYRIRFGPRDKGIQRTIKIIKKVGNRYFDNERGMYQVDSYGLLGNQLRYLLKYPLRRGQKWLSVVGYTSVERYRIIDTNRSIRVPAGLYHQCIVVRSRQKVSPRRVLEALHFYAPRVGPIKIATIAEIRGRRIPQWSLELLAYHPAK